MNIALYIQGPLVGHFKVSHSLWNYKLQFNHVFYCDIRSPVVAKEAPWHKRDLVRKPGGLGIVSDRQAGVVTPGA